MSDHWVQVDKVDLMEGEELMELPSKVIAALGREKAKLNKSVFLTHIFKDFIVVKDWETQKRFKMEMSRDKDGLISLGEMVEVRPAFVPVKQSTTKSEDGQEVVETDALVAIKVEKEEERNTPFWGGRFMP